MVAVFKAGAAAPDDGSAAVVYERFSLCSLGCGWPSRAASKLGCERCYVGTAVPEGGVDGEGVGAKWQQRHQRLSFRPGRRPRMLVRRPWSASGLPGVAGAAGG